MKKQPFKFTKKDLEIIKDNDRKITTVQLGLLLGIHESTLRKHMRAEKISFTPICNTKEKREPVFCSKMAKMQKPLLTDVTGQFVKDNEGKYVPIVTDSFMQSVYLY